MTTRVLQRGRHVMKYVMIQPLLVTALIALATGELVGYALGPGDALSKVE
jgi:hypothetical protein